MRFCSFGAGIHTFAGLRVKRAAGREVKPCTRALLVMFVTMGYQQECCTLHARKDVFIRRFVIFFLEPSRIIVLNTARTSESPMHRPTTHVHLIEDAH